MRGSTLRCRFERPSAGKHHGDQRTGQIFANQQRADQRQHRDQIDAGATAPQGGEHPDQRGYHRDQRAGDPESVSDGMPPRQPCDSAGRQRADRERRRGSAQRATAIGAILGEPLSLSFQSGDQVADVGAFAAGFFSVGDSQNRDVSDVDPVLRSCHGIDLAICRAPRVASDGHSHRAEGHERVGAKVPCSLTWDFGPIVSLASEM